MFGSDSRTIDQILDSMINHMVPQTDDRDLLNLISISQLKDATYVENVLPRNASSANFLVPHGLFRAKTNQVWRYPPYMEFDFRIVIKSANPKLRMKAGFGVPRYLKYKEYRLYGNRRGSIEVTQNIRVRYPNDFTKVRLLDCEYDVKGVNGISRKSVSPQFYQMDEEIELMPLLAESRQFPIAVQENEPIICQYDEHSGRTQRVNLDNPSKTLSGLPDNPSDPDPKVATISLRNEEIHVSVTIELRAGSKENEYYINVKMVNNCQLPDGMLSEKVWRPISIISPWIVVQFDGAEPDIGPQQHAEARSLAISGVERKIEAIPSHNQTNGVLTKSTLLPSTVVGTPYGIFDLLKEEPTLFEKDIDAMIASHDSLLECFPNNLRAKLEHNGKMIKSLKIVLSAVRDGFGVNRLYLYQWEAIKQRTSILLNGDSGTATIIKAPTGTGKTIVFMANAALNYLYTEGRAALVFPTRILNEDMFKRLTHFIYHLRANDASITGGIYIGSSDPLYGAIANPKPGQVMVQYSVCPHCKGEGSVKAVQNGQRVVGKCEKCNHVIDYMYGVKEVCDYLPSLTIATPDKMFYDATAAGFEQFNLRMVGGLYVKCSCGNCVPSMSNGEFLTCRLCQRQIARPFHTLSSPITYFVFDEVHSLYGMTGTLLSIFLKSLQLAADRIQYPNNVDAEPKTKFTFETGTATIANDIELITSITRIDASRVFIIPQNSEYNHYFGLNSNRIRYRTLLLLPVGTSARNSVSNAIYQHHYHIHWEQQYKNILKSELNKMGCNGNEYDFCLGYVFRKRDGYTLARTINDLASFQGVALTTKFISGDSSSQDIANIFALAQQNSIRVLIANMVMSLGIDIKNLNDMIMMGVAKSMTEHVQTAGRTGRGKSPGHVSIHLLPSNPRDQFVYENFHGVFSDVSGYYDSYPIQSTNAFAAQIILPNIMKLMLAATSYSRYILTAPQASRYFAQDIRHKQLLYLDLLKAITPTNTPASIRQQIGKDIISQLDRYILKFSEFSGRDQYISKILGGNEDLLVSLRARTGKEIEVLAIEPVLYEHLERTSKSFSGIYNTQDIDVNEEDGD